VANEEGKEDSWEDQKDERRRRAPAHTCGFER